MPIELADLLQAPPAFEMRPAFLFPTSPGAGKEAGQVYGQLKSLEGISPYSGSIAVAPLRFEAMRGQPIRAPRTLPAKVPSTEEALFQNRARLKIMTSTVAMHLTDLTRGWLFEALDELLNLEVWHEGDSVLDPNSFATYLRLLIYQRRVTRASLGIANSGNLLAAWVTPAHRLTMEFLASDQLRWALSCGEGESREVAAGLCGVRRLFAVLSPYNATGWFVEDANADRR